MSLYLLKADALFLHVPKTGGIWVQAALKAAGIATTWASVRLGVSTGHAPLWGYVHTYPFAFGFVRHPLAWYSSYFRFQCANGWPNWEAPSWHPQACLAPYASLTFAVFVQMVLAHEPSYVTRMYEWYFGPPGTMYIDAIGHQETLAQDLVAILTRLGYQGHEEPIMATPMANESPGVARWDRELFEQVLCSETPAIRRFYGDAALPLLWRDGRTTDV